MATQASLTARYVTVRVSGLVFLHRTRAAYRRGVPERTGVPREVVYRGVRWAGWWYPGTSGQGSTLATRSPINPRRRITWAAALLSRKSGPGCPTRTWSKRARTAKVVLPGLPGAETGLFAGRKAGPGQEMRLPTARRGLFLSLLSRISRNPSLLRHFLRNREESGQNRH